MSDDSELSQFLGAYLHQDWPDEFADEWAALDAYLHANPACASGLLRDVTSLLARAKNETDLAATVLGRGGFFAADWDGGTYRGWLEEVARRVEAAVDRSH